jgi:phosphatidylinositol 4-kinase
MLVIRGFLEVRKHGHLLLPLVDVMYQCGCQLPCFKAGAAAVADMRARFLPNASEQQVGLVALLLIGAGR